MLRNDNVPTTGDDAGCRGALPHCLYTGDLVHLTRRPLFLIVDSANSAAFEVVGLRHAGLDCFVNAYFVSSTPALDLALRPTCPHTIVADKHTHYHQGRSCPNRLFVYFVPLFPNKGGGRHIRVCNAGLLTARHSTRLHALHLRLTSQACPLPCRLADIPEQMYRKCDEHLASFYAAVADRFKSNKSGTAAWYMYLTDDFLRLLIFRFVFCCTVLRLNKAFTGKVCIQ